MMMPNELYSKNKDSNEKTFTLEQIKEAQLLFLTYYYTDSYDKDEDVDIFGKFLSEDYYPGMNLYTGSAKPVSSDPVICQCFSVSTGSTSASKLSQIHLTFSSFSLVLNVQVE